MNQLELLEKAIGIAVEAHRGQKDRYGAPYILHPLRVMARLASPEEQIVGILHDVVEDTRWRFEDLAREGVPESLLEALRAVTRDPEESYEHFVERSAANPLARRVKLADLADNMDTRRMPQIGKDETERLAKYLRAWNRLTQAPDR